MFWTSESEQLTPRTTGNRTQRSTPPAESDVAPSPEKMLQRDMESIWPYKVATPSIVVTSESSAPQAADKCTHKLRAKLRRVYERLSESDWERQRRESEEYLAGSVDLYDLEQRMRRHDRFLAQRGERLL